MNYARVIGSIWATRKYDSLTGRRMLFIQPLTFSGEKVGEPIVALDTVDSGVGDMVIFVGASEAAIPFRPAMTPTDATIVGIVERVDLAP
jgi:ethanolamine utilization protein EutN